MKLQFLFLFSLLSFSIILFSCEYNYIEPVIPIPEDTISFSGDIIPLFNNSCNMSGCHGVGDAPPDLSPANAYNDLFAENMIDTINPEQSILYIEMATGGSMEIYSTTFETATILTWIERGAKNN